MALLSLSQLFTMLKNSEVQASSKQKLSVAFYMFVTNQCCVYPTRTYAGKKRTNQPGIFIITFTSEMDLTIYRKQALLRYHLPAIYQANEFHGDKLFRDKSNELITLLTRCFEDESNFHSNDFNYLPMDVIIDYIRRTHKLYLDKLLQEMEQSIHLLASAYPSGHPLLFILNRFYSRYKTELVMHIRQEDDKLLPYIHYLSTCLKSGFDAYGFFRHRKKFSIQKFIDNHHDNDIALERIRDKVLSYDPPQVNRFMHGVLVHQLDFFRQDLKLHGLIEDRVLIPRAMDMEHRVETFLNKTAALN